MSAPPLALVRIKTDRRSVFSGVESWPVQWIMEACSHPRVPPWGIIGAGAEWGLMNRHWSLGVWDSYSAGARETASGCSHRNVRGRVMKLHSEGSTE